MRRVVATLELLWALAHIVLAYLFVTSAFVAKTAAHEGLPAQAALLLGGLLIGGFAVLLLRQCLEAIRAPDIGET